MKTDETNLPPNPRPIKPERAIGPVARPAGAHSKTEEERERDALDAWRQRRDDGFPDPVSVHGFDPAAESVQTRAVIEAFSSDLAHLHEALEAAEARLERAERARRIDPATGLLRRDALLSEIPHLEALDRREGVASEIAVLSVDGLPALRETQGRAAAERAMDVLGRALAEAIAAGEPAGRLGDGDFVVLLTGRRGPAAREHAEALAAAVSAAIDGSVETVGLRPGSVSVGLAKLDPLETPWKAIDRADHDVRWAARRRNRLGDYVRHQHGVEAGELILDRKFAFLHAAHLQFVEGRAFRDAVDHLIQIAMLLGQTTDLRVNLRFFKLVHFGLRNSRAE